MSAALPTFAHHDALLALARPEALEATPELGARWVGWLDDDERQRWQGFRFARHRTLFLCAHALLRRTLSRCAPVEPAAWRFVRQPHGRPVVAGPAAGRHLSFSLSHTEGLAACLVTLHPCAGVDVEAVGSAHLATAVDGLAATVLTDAERAELAAAPSAERPERFYRHWTLKEAYAKARGLGLQLDLQTVSFGLGSAGHIAARLPAGDDSDAWTFLQRSVVPGHVLAAAVRTGERGLLRWRLEET